MSWSNWSIEQVRRLQAENAELVSVLHEVEQEAVYAYHCLQQDCVTTANSSEHFFKKWWHAECELDRTREENAKLREAVATAIKVQAVLCGDADRAYCHKKCPLHRQESDDCLACDVIGVAQELGIEVDG